MSGENTEAKLQNAEFKGRPKQDVPLGCLSLTSSRQIAPKPIQSRHSCFFPTRILHLRSTF
jgi:hypothetical protein